MLSTPNFEFERTRGIVWVCDLVGSSSYLNSNESVDDLERFLPRLYWVSHGLVEAAGGRFIKWTGDGFLAWFETPLHRLVGERAYTVFKAAGFLTFLVNVTQLGLKPQRKFRIRHGVTYEHDALVIRFIQPNGHEGLDLIGRAVVLAFRLPGLEAAYPGIATQRQLTVAAAEYGEMSINFKKRDILRDDRLKYFKGERWGTESICVSSDRTPRRLSRGTAIRRAKEAVALAEGRKPPPSTEPNFMHAFLQYMLLGPDWSRETGEELARFVSEGLLGTLKKMIDLLESVDHER